MFLEFHYFGLQKVPIIPSDGGISRVREVYLGFNLPFFSFIFQKVDAMSAGPFILL